MSQLFFENETYAIRGAIFEVYREMGAGFWSQYIRNVWKWGFLRWRFLLYPIQN